MPSAHPPSQPEDRPAGRPEQQADSPILSEIQRAAIPELTRVFGQYGLYLRPTSAFSSDLSGNMLGTILSLQRHHDRLDGQLQCLDAALPIRNASLSLVYALFMLESSPEPAALMEEIARSLKPEGVALVISLNPLSPARLPWRQAPKRGLSSSAVERMARDAGLVVIRRQCIGPFWLRNAYSLSEPGGTGWIDRFRAANLVVLRRRDAALTPLRKATSAVNLRPGMSAG